MMEGPKRIRRIRFRFGRHREIAADRISTLPEAVIHDNILSRLDSKDVKVMTSLSKTWYKICNSFPCLDFTDTPFLQHLNLLHHTDEEEEYLVNNYVNYVDQTLRRFHNLNPPHQNNIIRRIVLPLNFSPRLAPILDTWIDLVLQQGVEDFNFLITNPFERSNSDLYDLPPHFFSHPNSSIIKAACVTGCSLLHSFPKPIPKPNLLMKKLCLEEVLMDDTTLTCIISCCPLIEDLFISDSMDKINCLRISHLHKLKHLTISSYEWKHIITHHQNIINVEIDAPSLQSLKIRGSLFKLCIVGCCPTLTDLELSEVNEKELELQDILSRLPLLRCLSLHHLDSTTNLKVSSDTLNKLVIYGCNNLVELCIDDAPNLLSAVYICNFPHPDLRIASSSSLVRWEVTSEFAASSFISAYKTVEDFLVDTSNFVAKMKNVESLKLYFHTYPENIGFNELKQRSVQPHVANVDNLKLCYGENINNHLLLLILLDGVLWSCHPRTLSIWIRMDDDNDGVKSICMNLMGHRGGCCSCTLARRSWLHHLEEVMHVTKDGTDSEYPMHREEIIFIFKW